MFGSLGFTEIALIVGVLIILFGAKQLPKLGRALAETVTEFRKVGKEMTDVGDEVRDAIEDIEDEARDAVGAPKKRHGRRT